MATSNDGKDSKTQNIQAKYCKDCYAKKTPYDKEEYAHLSDVIIKVGERRFKCHWFQLTRHSEVFDRIFREGAWKESKDRDVEISGFSEETVAIFINFLYGGRLEKADEYSKELMELASLYNVSELVDRCQEELKKKNENQNDQGTQTLQYLFIPPGRKCRMCAWNFYPYNAEKDQHLSDFTIKVGDTEFAVHKLKLSRTSDVFDKMFRDDSNQEELVIENFAVETVKDYIDFVYLGYLEDSWEKYNQALYRMSVKYENDPLEIQVGDVIRERMDNFSPEVMVELWDLAEQAWNRHLLHGVWWHFAERWHNTPTSSFPGLDELLQRNPVYKHNFCVYMSEREEDQLLDIEMDTEDCDQLEKRVAELEQQLDEIR